MPGGFGGGGGLVKLSSGSLSFTSTTKGQIDFRNFAVNDQFSRLKLQLSKLAGGGSTTANLINLRFMLAGAELATTAYTNASGATAATSAQIMQAAVGASIIGGYMDIDLIGFMKSSAEVPCANVAAAMSANAAGGTGYAAFKDTVEYAVATNADGISFFTNSTTLPITANYVLWGQA